MAEITTQTNTPEQIQTPAGSTSSDFMTKVQEQLLGQSQMVSSTTGSLEQKIQDAITSTQKGTEASKSAIQSAYDRQLSYDTQTAQESLTAGRAAGSGGIMNIGALRELTRTTDQHLKDLEQRKQELMLQADAAGYKQVSDLQIKALEFKQQAEQQVFANLLGMANLGMQAKQEDRLSRAQSFQEQQTIASTALEYGLTVQPGETLDSIVTRAMPIASKQKRLELAKLQAETNRANAEATKALNGEAGNNSFDTMTAGILADAFRKGNTGFLAGLKTNEQYASVWNAIDEQNKKQDEYIASKYSEWASLGNINAITKQIANDPNIIVDATKANEIALQVMASKPKQKTTGGIVGEFFTGGGVKRAATTAVEAKFPIASQIIKKINK